MNEPIQALQLILTHLAKLDDRWLNAEAVPSAHLPFIFLIGQELSVFRSFVLLCVAVAPLAPASNSTVQSI
jgi:hypothetical protein